MSRERDPLVRRFFYAILGIMFLREWYVKRALRELLGAKKEPFTMFDAGSGFGQYSYYCAKHFPPATIHAVDVKDEQIADCRYFFSKQKLEQCLVRSRRPDNSQTQRAI